MPDQDYANKQDIRELKHELKQDIRGLHTRIDEMQDHLIEAMREMQTEVLHAFRNWTGPTDIKMRGHEERIALMEERLRQIERVLIEKNPPKVQ